ncbi:membrane protein insertase YidC [Ginsengibacter hankyongi]|uniref:Membrane protein insertase YidC n=2 Tax=Ginsengibacter hankyongi TaxID=2607284 RepID=A0A5J5IJZ6_9BACT|nr:membrane protein insertase YidC [Ginsengibacter hankyongi]
MGMDRNTVIGFVLLALLFFGYFYYSSQGKLALEKQQQHIKDSLDKLKPKIDTSLNTGKITNGALKPDSSAANIKQDTSGKEEFFTLENKVLKITFTNKGGQPKKVELKNFKTFDKKALILQDGSFNNISYTINTGNNQTAQTSDLLFTPSAPKTDSNGNTIISYSLETKSGQTIEHQYILQPDDYMVGWNIKLNGADKLITQNALNLTWQTKADKQEKDIEWETQQSHISFVEGGDYDFEHLVEGKDDDKKFIKPLDWVALNQQFFASSILAKNKFSSGEIKWQSPKDTSLHIIGEATANLKLDVPSGNEAVIPLQLFYGPSDYKILKSYGNQMYNMVPLGSGIFAFVKYVNRGFIMPVFNFLSGKIASFGLIIALLTIVIRLLISPLTYQSYLSGAKMKLLKPEIDALKAKYGDDKQGFGMEQMKLFRSAGVNPLGGCIPAILQIPIFFALYNFFNSNITLRGQSFWWAKDLSSYDSIYNLPFSIPFYGNHVSLFTIFAVVTSLLISLYGMSNMQDNSNPVMKYMPFIFPVILLGVFNRLPSSLTWYYTVSNAITLLIQFVIQKYIIDHEKVLAKLQENKKKPVTQNKWQEKITAMQETNKKLQTMQQKKNTNKKK